MHKSFFAKALTVAEPGLKKAAHGVAATLIYLFAGAVGIPVFSAFTGGLQCLLGPTGGFFLPFP